MFIMFLLAVALHWCSYKTSNTQGIGSISTRAIALLSCELSRLFAALIWMAQKPVVFETNNKGNFFGNFIT
jgi:hypothetical protein